MWWWTHHFERFIFKPDLISFFYRCKNTIVNSAEEGGNVFTFSGLSVCLSVCEQDHAKSCGWIFMKVVLFGRHSQEEVDPNRGPKKQLGDTSFYCPVSLTEKGVLWPGDPECSAKYREKIYYFADETAREKFLATPDAFLPKDSPHVVCCLQF